MYLLRWTSGFYQRGEYWWRQGGMTWMERNFCSLAAPSFCCLNCFLRGRSVPVWAGGNQLPWFWVSTLNSQMPGWEAHEHLLSEYWQYLPGGESLHPFRRKESKEGTIYGKASDTCSASWVRQRKLNNIVQCLKLSSSYMKLMFHL